MATIEGVVEKVSEQKSPAGSARKWTKKGLLIDGAWFNIFVNHDNQNLMNSITQGSAVKLETQQDGAYTNVVKVELVSPSAAKASPVIAKSVANYAEKDYRITYLASRRDALEFVTKLLPLDLLPLPSKKTDKVDAILGYVEHYADKFAAVAMAAKLKDVTKENNDNDQSASDSDVE